MKRLATLAACLCASPVYGGDVDIELLAFERATPAALASEAWPASVRTPDLSRARDLSEAQEGGEPLAFQQLPKSALQLTEAKQRLQRAGYRTLAHLAWRQPLSGEAVHVFGGKNFAPGQSGPEPIAVMESQDVLAAQTDPSGMAPIWQLDGWVKLSASAPLSLDTELILRLPAPPSSEGAEPSPAFAQYPFTLSRKLTLGESQYFDHPLMGLLVQVRADPAVTPNQDAQSSAAPAAQSGSNLEPPLPEVKEQP